MISIMKHRPIKILGVCFIAAIGLTTAGVQVAWHHKDDETRRKVLQVQNDWQTLFRGMSGLAVDNCNCFFPSDTTWRDDQRPTLGTAFPNYSFHHHWPACAYAVSLTTPIAYVESIPTDPFDEGQEYGFVAWHYYAYEPSIALFHSPGPDGDVDIYPARIYAVIQSRLEQIADNTSPTGFRLDYTPKTAAAAQSMAAQFQYDPTNGTQSDGDLVQLYTLCASGGGFGFLTGDRMDVTLFKSAAENSLSILNAEFPSDIRIPTPRYPNAALTEEVYARKSGLAIVDLQFSKYFELYISDQHAQREPLSVLANRLAAFEEFFKNPRGLSTAEVERLGQWKTEQAFWWNLIRDEPQINDGPRTFANLDYFAKFFVFYGKSLLLLAGAEVAEGNPSKAQAILSVLDHRLRSLPMDDDASEVNLFARRVREEMIRMSAELRKAAGGARAD